MFLHFLWRGFPEFPRLAIPALHLPSAAPLVGPSPICVTSKNEINDPAKGHGQLLPADI